MSIRARRNSLLKSSISINTIRDSAVSFNEGLSKSNTTAGSIVQKTNDNNNFKRRLIANDNQYFRKRQENVRRKAREDELEASTVQGVAKKTGSLTATSTRGFLGRILDFFGIVLLGWFINTLPKIIESIRGLINRIGKLTGLLTGFIGSISNFLVDFGTDWPPRRFKQGGFQEAQTNSGGGNLLAIYKCFKIAFCFSWLSALIWGGL